MSFFQNPSFYVQTAENDVIAFFAKLKADVAVGEQDLINAVNFIAPYVQSLGTQVSAGVALAAAAGIGVPAPLVLAATVISGVASTVNAAVAAQQEAAASGQDLNQQTAVLLQTGYQQAKTAQAHLANGQAILAGATTPATAPAAPTPAS